MNHPFGAEFSASIRNKPKKTFMYTPAIQLSSDDEDDEFYNQTVSSISSSAKLDPIDEEHLLDPHHHHHHSEHTINSSSLHHDDDIIKPMIHPITVPLSNGYTCSFPYHPYPSQIELMNRVIFTLDHTEKGHHAILESPTGTGKTLSLLCATLCWQQHFKAKIIQQWKEKHETHNKEHVHSSSSSTSSSSSWTSTANSGSTHDTRMNEFTTVPAEVSSSSSPLKRLHDSKILSLDSNHPWSTGTSNTSSRSSHHDESTTIPPPSTKKQKLDMNNTSSECNMQQISKILLYLQKGFTNKAEREILKSTKLPKIIYSCRTHSQIKQVVKELRKTCYAPKMTILGSKQQYCIHPMMNHGSSKNHFHHGTTSTCDVNTECQKLIDASNCYYYKNMYALVKSSNYSPHSKHLIYDIEDLIKEGKRLKSCPYFASKEFLLDPEIELILCPYNYILSPITREMMSLDVHNSVCIFDEAHNLEDACRESTSLTLSEYELEHVCAFELNFILSKMMNSTIVSNRNSTLNSSTDSTVTNFTTNSTIHSNPTTHHDEWNSTKIQYKYYKILVDFILKILQWMNMQVLTPLSNDDSSIEGKIIKEQDGIMNEFMKHIFDPRNMMHQELKQIKDALFHVKSFTPSNKKQDLRLSQRSLNMLQELCTIFDLMLRDDFKFMKDYAIVLIKKAVPHHLNTITTNANTNTNANTTTASSSSSTTSSSTSSHSSSYNNIHHQRMVRTDGINSSSSGIPSLTNVPTTTSSSLTIEYQINFWCLSPAVAFEELQLNSKCTLLASGTLSPLDTFSNELKTQFTTTFEAEHVIEQDQVWVGTLGQSHGVSLNANYTNSNTTQYQDELGRIILSICQQDCTRNGGILVFFPSYSFMNKILKRWKSYNHSIPSSNCSSLLKQIEQVKDVFFEEKGTSIEETISKYYASIEEHKNRNNTTTTTTTSAARTRTTASTATTSAARTTTTATSKNGALFIAVCRGKVSEGIDFSNDKCRMVICIGIPYPNIKDLKVSLKREYNDSVNNASNNNGNTGHSNSYSNNSNNNSNNNSMDGEHWYTSQAFRALNQAVGRCIRHKNDYGAILLIDERFQNKNSAKTVNAFSKWIRTRIVNYPSLESSLKSLSEFFEWNHEHFSENTTTTTTTTTTNTTNTTTTTTTPTTTNTFRAEQHILRSTLKEQINTHRRRSIVRSDVILNDDSSNESLEMLSDDDEMTNDDDETKLQIPFMEQNSTPTTLISPHRTLPQSSHATHHGLSKNRMPNPMVTTTQSNSSSSTTDTRRHRMDSTATIYCSSCQKTLVSMNSSCQVISLLQPPPHHSMLRSILSSFENVYAQDQVLRVDSKLTSMIPCRQEYSSNQNHWTFYHHESTSPLDDSFGHHVATLDSSQMKHVLKFTNQQQDFSIQLSMKDKSQNKIITPFSESEGVVYSVLFCKNCSFVSGVKIIATDEDHQQDINCSYLFIPTTRRCFMNQKGDEPVDSNATNNTFRNEGEVVVISSDDDDNE
ncbi:hypothetical protein C9374_004563 [Naegleria lovaniensis]|uniref:Helicase ATP-binding domain-containing protein n=1 Tax=Naegleria lovaniensis TaxID=51637 RepID=A0AA88KP21_NAELO|nr:uncharacterized protein C9374_004563 [Naegleria lovaniensis]KAG2383226.1 hypothetical protein C9374_004563 [Naegleria lovaniensis]